MDDMTDKLVEWIDKQIEYKGWSARELARRAEVSHSTINDLRAQKIPRPNPDTVLGLARAFKTPPERLFRMAGLLPPITIGNGDIPEENELVEYFRYLDKQDRQAVIALARAMYEKK